MFSDFVKYQNELNILIAAQHLGDQLCILHGDQDESVPISEAYELAEAARQEVLVIKGANHVFGTAHPWTDEGWPPLLKQITEKTLLQLL